jgi:hypothetical protein
MFFFKAFTLSLPQEVRGFQSEVEYANFIGEGVCEYTSLHVDTR